MKMRIKGIITTRHVKGGHINKQNTKGITSSTQNEKEKAEQQHKR
jgi:hypothetical protein